MKKRSLSSCATVGLCLLLTACAAPKPGPDYQHATNAIRAAEIAGAERYAPNELSVAVSHFEKADSLVRNNRCLLYTSPSPRDRQKSRMPSSA